MVAKSSVMCIPGFFTRLPCYLRQPLAAVQQPLHCLRLELPREAPSGSPLRHPSLLGCLGSLANPPAPGGKSTRKLAVILHRMWADGSEFRWGRDQTTAAAV